MSFPSIYRLDGFVLYDWLRERGLIPKFILYVSSEKNLQSFKKCECLTCVKMMWSHRVFKQSIGWWGKHGPNESGKNEWMHSLMFDIYCIQLPIIHSFVRSREMKKYPFLIQGQGQHDKTMRNERQHMIVVVTIVILTVPIKEQTQNDDWQRNVDQWWQTLQENELLTNW